MTMWAQLRGVYGMELENNCEMGRDYVTAAELNILELKYGLCEGPS